MKNVNEMTIFYKKRTLEIDVIALRRKDLSIYSLDKEDAELIYGYIVIPFDEYISNHTNLFELYKDGNDNINIRMKNEVKNDLKKYL